MKSIKSTIIRLVFLIRYAKLRKNEKHIRIFSIVIYLLIFALGFLINKELIRVFGYINSVIIGTIITIIINILFIKFYDSQKIDSGFIEALKEAQANGTELPKSRIAKLVKWTKNHKGLLLILFILTDSKFVVLVFRKGFYLYDGFQNWRIKSLFILSIVLANFWINGLVYIIIWLWNNIF